MTKKEATQRAWKYAQGDQWIVVTKDDSGRLYESHSMDYFSACAKVRQAQVSIRFGDDINPANYDIDGNQIG